MLELSVYAPLSKTLVQFESTTAAFGDGSGLGARLGIGVGSADIVGVWGGTAEGATGVGVVAGAACWPPRQPQRRTTASKEKSATMRTVFTKTTP